MEPLVTVSAEGVIVSSVKLADDRSGDLIVRIYESRGRRAAGSLDVGCVHRSIREVSLIEDEIPDARTGAAFALTPFEVRTFRIVR